MKLHLRWPDRKKQKGSDEEAIEFYKWLFLNHHELPEVETLETVEDVEGFLEQNENVLQEKSVQKEDPISNTRIEPRIENSFSVVLLVDECEENVELVGMTLNGRTQDLGLHGMKVSIEKILPKGSKLSLMLDADDGESFELLGETRWVRPLGEGQLIGLKIVESEGFEIWRSQFGVRFVAPIIGRNYKPKE